MLDDDQSPEVQSELTGEERQLDGHAVKTGERPKVTLKEVSVEGSEANEVNELNETVDSGTAEANETVYQNRTAKANESLDESETADQNESVGESETAEPSKTIAHVNHGDDGNDGSVLTGLNNDATGDTNSQSSVLNTLSAVPPKRARKKGMRPLSKLLIWLVLFVSIWIFGRDMIGFVDRQLAKNQYNAIPIARLTDPLFSANTKDAYWEALKNGALGSLRDTSAPSSLESVLTDLRKMPDSDNLALTPYIHWVLGKYQDNVLPAGWPESSSAENRLKSAIDGVSRLTSPDNRVVADAYRSLARLYSSEKTRLPEAERSAQKALEIDTRGAGPISEPVLEDERLLRTIFASEQDFAKAEECWEQSLKIARQVYGENDVRYAFQLAEHASYLLERGQKNASVAAARGAVEILGHHTESPTQGNSDRNNTVDHLFHYIVKLQALDFTQDAIQLENQFLKTCGDIYGRKQDRTFSLIVRFGDHHVESKHYARAQELYERALSFGINQKRSVPKVTTSEYLDCMAKVADVYRLRNNLEQCFITTGNCLRLMDPFSNWTGRTDYSDALHQLSYTIGSIPKEAQSAEYQKQKEGLTNLLMKLARDQNTESRYQAQMALAGLYGLSGNPKLAQSWYATATGNRPLTRTRAKRLWRNNNSIRSVPSSPSAQTPLIRSRSVPPSAQTPLIRSRSVPPSAEPPFIP